MCCISGKTRQTDRRHSCFPAHPTWKDAFTTLSALDTVINANDADEKTVKAMDDIQDFVPTTCSQSLKLGSTNSYFKKQLPTIEF
jgi:hypothetical protein